MDAPIMQVSEHVHALRIPFALEIGPGKKLERFVYAYLIYGQQICLIDCGVATSQATILDYVQQSGRKAEELRLAVITHPHPDHIGGLRELTQAVGCKVAAHTDAVAWIENVDCQFQQRPVPGFHQLVGGSANVDLRLNDGDSLVLGNSQRLRVIPTPGHSRGHIALFYAEDGVLFSGDSIPLPGSLPIYEDVLASIESLRRLKAVEGVKVLLSSWDQPRSAEIPAAIDDGMAYLQRIHACVLDGKAATPSGNATDIARRVLRSLALPEAALNPIVIRSIAAHLEVSDRVNLLQV
jgi:hydroxyacylglutathione hydrolase